MNAVLIFLVIFIAASLVARLGHTSLFIRFLIAPTCVAIGLLLSPEGLGLLRAPILSGLDIFTQVSIAWLSFLLGLRRYSYAKAKSQKILVFFWPVFFTWLVTFLLTLTSIYFFGSDDGLFSLDTVHLLLASLFSSSLLIGREPMLLGRVRINVFHAAVIGLLGAVPLLMLLYADRYGAEYCYFPLLAAILIAAASALIQKLFFISIKESYGALVLSLIAISSILAGASIWYFVPHFLAAFLFGYFVSFFFRKEEGFTESLFMSEQPVRMVLMVLVGAQLKISFSIVAAGLLLGLLIYGTRVLLYFTVNSKIIDKRQVFSPFMGSGEVAVLFCVSMWFVFPYDLRAFNNLVLFILVASSVGDILGVARWAITLQRRMHKRQNDEI